MAKKDQSQLDENPERRRDQRLGAWIFGSLLLVFVVGVFFLPGAIWEYAARRIILTILISLMAGLLFYFLIGTAVSEQKDSKKRFAAKFTGGVAVFFVVLVAVKSMWPKNYVMSSIGKRLTVAVTGYAQNGPDDFVRSESFASKDESGIGDREIGLASDWIAQQIKLRCGQTNDSFEYSVSYRPEDVAAKNSGDESNSNSPISDRIAWIRERLESNGTNHNSSEAESSFERGILEKLKMLSLGEVVFKEQILFSMNPNRLPRALLIKPSDSLSRLDYWIVAYNPDDEHANVPVMFSNARELFQKTSSQIVLQLTRPGYDLQLLKLSPGEPSNTRVRLEKIRPSVVVPKVDGAESVTQKIWQQLSGKYGFRIVDQSTLERGNSVVRRVFIKDAEGLEKKASVLRENRIDFVVLASVDSKLQ